MAPSLDVYDFAAAVLRGDRPSPRLANRALAAPERYWTRVLAFEGCAVQLHRALSGANFTGFLPPWLGCMLQRETAESVRRAIMLRQQLREVAALAARHEIDVAVLKGAARIAAGEMPGQRSIADIDLLLRPRDAERFHGLLLRELSYEASGVAAPHHLGGLVRAGSLGIEIHHRLSGGADASSPNGISDATGKSAELLANLWREARPVDVGGATLLVPTPTHLLLHALEHAVTVNWTHRYRQRDLADVARLYTADVSPAALDSYVARSPQSSALKTLISAAGEIEQRLPLYRSGASRTVRRVARVRLALAVPLRDNLLAERVFQYAGVIAEGSPRSVQRLGANLVRRLGRHVPSAATVVAVAVVSASCGDSVSPNLTPVPPFVFTSLVDGLPGIYRSDANVVRRLSAPGQEDTQPHSAAGRIAYTSLRDGNAEIYVADTGLQNQQRLTNAPAPDGEPALDPAGTTIAFVSARSGTPRIWLMDVTGANQRPLATGSSTFIPERSPAWSPSGDVIAFTSARTNTSQLFSIPRAGGTATQITHESTGAFAPSWNGDGSALLFVTGGDSASVRHIARTGELAEVFTRASNRLADFTCTRSVCLATLGAADSDGDVVTLPGHGAQAAVVLGRLAADYDPAFLVP
ncbi:MAG: nucleotidyltransferase family protein [Gemmatimonadaceae bacterium]